MDEPRMITAIIGSSAQKRIFVLPNRYITALDSHCVKSPRQACRDPAALDSCVP